MSLRGIQKPEGFVVTTGNPLQPGYPQPDVNAVYGPYNSQEEAYRGCLEVYGNALTIPQGVTVGVYDEETTEIREYWNNAKKGGGYELSDFVLKISSASGKDAIQVEIQTDTGNIIHNGQGQVVLTAIVKRGGEEITDQINENAFSWKRESGNTESDNSWNATHGQGYKSIVVTKQDIYIKAQFTCSVEIDN